mmetsp:Transcript_86776/g.280404  ORF Transcript_86776/g.280404 Transcript_86776/m.280404 type:complete len:151 (-) Transcript_86776:22-474(-)
MKSRWDLLGDSYAGHPKVLIGDVDCTVQERLCESYGVSGYPTLKYFTKNTDTQGQKYTGDRFIEDLEALVKEKLLGGCEVDQLAACSEKEMAYIVKMKARSKADVTKELARLEGLLSGDMAPEKLAWLSSRVGILRQLSTGTENVASDEL